jgi:hypothetical protein
VITVAGTGGIGATNGVGTAASFSRPRGIVCDASGNAYVAVNNHQIRKIVLSSMTVTTFAGTGSISAANGVGTNAGFNFPVSVAVDSSGTLLFVADSGNNLIRQIVVATQTVTTLAGNGTAGVANGVGAAAQFHTPYGLAVDSSGNLFVCDFGSYLVRQIVIATKTVTTIAGSGVSSTINGFGTNAAFGKPSGLAMDARGNLLLADQTFRVRLLQPTVPCPAGMNCAPGADAVACAPGFYCATGAIAAMPCTQGSYCAVAGLSAPNGTCDGGFFCTAGSSTATQNLCSSGTYCPRGSFQTTTCPVRAFCASDGLANYTLCTPGYFCNATGLSAVSGACEAGAYCPLASLVPVHCPAGAFCASAAMSVPTPCIPGSYCATAALTAGTGACVSGQYCPAASTAAAACAAGSVCANSSIQVTCSGGQHCPAATTAAAPCPAGSFCATPASALAACAQGYYCPAGSTSATQVVCLAGAFHCPAGSSVPVSIACAVGYDFLYVVRYCLLCKCG